MEACSSYRPCQDEKAHKTFLSPSQGKSLYYYLYFIDAAFGLCCVRVTIWAPWAPWAPFWLQLYFNGYCWLALRLDNVGIAYEMADNALIMIDDFGKGRDKNSAFIT